MDFQRQYGRGDGEGEGRSGRYGEGPGREGRGNGDADWQRRPEDEASRYGQGRFGARVSGRYAGEMDDERAYPEQFWDRSRGTQTGGSLYGQGRHQEASWRPGSETLRSGDLRGPRERDYGIANRWQEPSPSFRGGEDFRRSGAGPHAGKGPKGYIRSDERIKEQVSERLEEHGEVDASEITVSVNEGEVTLEGTIADRSMKRMAEELVEDSPGVKQVHNRLRIDKDNGRQTGRSGALNTGKDS